MGNHNIAHLLILLLNLGTLLISLACPYCPYPTPPTKPPRVHPPKVKPPPSSPKLPSKPPHKHPPTTKPPHKHPPTTKPPKPPVVKPPSHVPKPPSTKNPPHKPTHPVVSGPPSVLPPIIRPPISKPPIVYPPINPKPPTEPNPPALCPPPPQPKVQETCPIDTLKLDACVDVLGGLIHIGIGADANDKCCPVIKGLVDLDAALCLCTTIKAKLLNINIFIPIALQVLVDCGKHPPPGFQCPA